MYRLKLKLNYYLQSMLRNVNAVCLGANISITLWNTSTEDV